MYFANTFIVLTAAVALVSASPTVNKRADDPDPHPDIDDCNGTIGDCYSNYCSPSFSAPMDTIGWCTAGKYNGCPCEKCGGGLGYVGPCAYNGCNGYQGICQAGQYEGCLCG